MTNPDSKAGALEHHPEPVSDADPVESHVPVAGPTPDQASAYMPPRALPKVSEHKTIETAPVRLAREIDPRHAPTARIRLRRAASPDSPIARAKRVIGRMPIWVGAALVVAAAGFLVWVATSKDPLAEPARVEVDALPQKASPPADQAARPARKTLAESPAATDMTPQLPSAAAPASVAPPAASRGTPPAAPRRPPRAVWLE